ncbi:Uncharacterised protein [Mycobacteroides abscessus]|uniref:hypothetical protein n=1 Tax=Mycobacteroides abscessus TaxID=36809 RepID=UPI0005E82763|nr:hypothetical protein [Mycobacteroides abscessus]CPW99320.1 Uncharacterised protein [Mycobacteroides abscessus]
MVYRIDLGGETVNEHRVVEALTETAHVMGAAVVAARERKGRYRVDGATEPWDIVVDVNGQVHLSAPTRPDADPAVQVARLYELAGSLRPIGLAGVDRELQLPIEAVTALDVPAKQFAEEMEQSKSISPDLQPPADTDRVPWPVNWSEYEPFARVGGFAWGVDLSREDAVARYNQVVECAPERIEALRGLARAHGLDFGPAPEQLDKLNEWFINSVEDAPGAYTLRPECHSVLYDITIFIGQTLVERNPALRWSVTTKGSRRTVPHFQETVVSGFKDAPYGLDVFEHVLRVGAAATALNGLRPEHETTFSSLVEASES